MVLYGSAIASHNAEDFSVNRLRILTIKEIERRYQEMKGKIVGEWEPMLREFLRKEFTKQICEYVIEKIKTALPIIFRDLENLRAYFKHLRQENISAIIATSPIKNIHEMDLFYQLARNICKL